MAYATHDDDRRFIRKLVICSAIAFAIGALLWATGAGAAQSTAKPEQGVPDAGLTLNDCLLILQGLERLDEKQTIVLNKGKPNETVIQDYYEFPKVETQLNIARNVALLNSIRREVQPVQQRIFHQILKTVPEIKPGTPATSIPDGSPQQEEFNAKMQDLTKRPCQAQLARLNALDLDLGKNRIPTSVLSLIDKILDR